tara:strand:+ start:7972 stop:9084 length:1113 start_codon:yes stop_codon:yes gene_type:complete
MHVGLASGFAYQGGPHGSDDQFLRNEVENLILADSLGYDSVWITEHHFTDYSMSNDPLQLLTYIAGRTKHVKLGTQCIIVPWHNPARLAEKIVNLDILSGGRAILGFGGGLAPHEFAGLGVDQNDSRALYNDTLDVVIRALETGVLEGEGAYGTIPRSELRPRPIKSFAGRKFCGSLSGSSMYAAARHGFGNMVLMLPQRGAETPPDQYREVWQEVHGAGSEPPRPMVSGNFYIHEDGAYAEEQGRKYLAATMRAAVKNYSLDQPGAFTNVTGYEHYEKMMLHSEAEIDAYCEKFGQNAVTGTPQQILDRLWELKEIYDPQGFFPHLHFGGMPNDDAVRAIHLFAETVMPEVKSWEADQSIDERFAEAAE